MTVVGIYDGTIYFNPVNHFSIISVKTRDERVPQEMRSARRHRDNMIRFTAVGYELPRTDAVQLDLTGEWVNSKYGYQLQVEQWHEIVPQSLDGIRGYLASGLIKGIGPVTAAEIVAHFGSDTLDIFDHHPEQLLEIRGITESKLEEIKTSYAASRSMRELMTLLSPFKVTPRTAQSIYEFFGPTCVDIMKNDPYALCQVSGFGFKRVDAIVRKTDNRLHDPRRIKGALMYALDDAKGKQGHLFLPAEALIHSTLRLLNDSINVPEQRVTKQEAGEALKEAVLHGDVVCHKDGIYLARTFAQEDATARMLAKLLARPCEQENIDDTLRLVLQEYGIELSGKQETAVHQAFSSGLSVITGSPGTGKTTVLKTIIEVYKRLHPKGELALMAPTGRASRRMAESTGQEGARTLHSALGLGAGLDGDTVSKGRRQLDADLVIIDEFSMVDMWLANQLFLRLRSSARIVLVGDADQLPSVGAGNVFHEIIESGLVPVTVLDRIFRQSSQSLIAYNAKFINNGSASLYYGDDFQFIPADNQADAAAKVVECYQQEVAQCGIENVQILSPFRSDGEASANHLNEVIREIVNPFRSAEEEVTVGTRRFRIGDRVMQTKNTERVSNGDLGFIRFTYTPRPGGKVAKLDFGPDRQMDYTLDDMANLDWAYATTIHKAMGSEYEVVIIPLIKAHIIMMYRNLLYTGITRAKRKVILVGQKPVLHMAISRTEVSKRNTMLAERMQMYFRAFSAEGPQQEEQVLPKAG